MHQSRWVHNTNSDAMFGEAAFRYFNCFDVHSNFTITVIVAHLSSETIGRYKLDRTEETE